MVNSLHFKIRKKKAELLIYQWNVKKGKWTQKLTLRLLFSVVSKMCCLFVLVVFWKTLKNFFKSQSKKIRLYGLFAALRVVRKDF
jgi:hypothetical protein